MCACVECVCNKSFVTIARVFHFAINPEMFIRIISVMLFLLLVANYTFHLPVQSSVIYPLTSERNNHFFCLLSLSFSVL